MVHGCGFQIYFLFRFSEYSLFNARLLKSLGFLFIAALCSSQAAQRPRASAVAHSPWYLSIISQIVLLDIVFSIDSVITAIGLTDEVWVIVTAVISSFVAVLAFAGPIGEFILKHPSIIWWS